MSRILGLDVGTNSLGWAILDPFQKVFVDTGVVVFQQGIPEEKGREAECSPAAERRKFRAARRLKYRRRLRKYHTLKVLIENQMCPLTIPELQNWIRNGKFPIENREFIAWLSSTKEDNPYYFRAKAAERKLPPLELGRAFYHLAIRRGFRSSRKESSSANDKELTNFKKEINQLTEILQRKQCTLGQYFYELFQKSEKIRKVNRCGRKEHYEPEFDKICEVQNLPEPFVSEMRKAIFLQRPLRSQKYLAGHCSLEKKRVRCLIGHPLFERYRMLSFINSIRKNGVPLNEQERQKAQAAFLVSKPSFEFEKLVRKLYPGYPKNEWSEWNYPPDKSIASSPVTNQLQKIVGTADLFAWHHEYIGRDNKPKSMDYQTLFDALTFFDDDGMLKNFAIERAGLTVDQAEKFVKIRIPTGYANFSLYAIRKILPFLEAGHIQTRAVFLAKLPDVLGKDVFQKNGEKIIADLEQLEADWRMERESASESGERAAFLSLTERIKHYLEDEFHVTPDRFELLYRYNSRSDYQDHTRSGILPEVNLGMIYNPMVYRSLNVLRRLVNHLRKTGKIDADTEIHVELARSVNDKNTRMAVANDQKKQENLRKQYKEAIEAEGFEATEERILRYVLWMEQNKHCLYTGKAIGLADLMSENNLVELEHTVPRSRGGDSSRENLTLCFTDYNRYTKKNGLPTACPNYDVKWKEYNSIRENIKVAGWEEKRENLRSRLEKLRSAARGNPQKRVEMLECRREFEYWCAKLAAFEITDEELRRKGFSRRQLVDTGIIARHAVFLLKSVYGNTYSRNGRVTEWVRKAWGVQGIYEKKDRCDHRHHAIDAMCIAALTEDFFQKISAAHRADEEKAMAYARYNSTLPDAYPWRSFPEDVFEKSEEILVTHFTRHNETKQAKKQVHLVTPYKTADGGLRRVVTAGGDTVRGPLHKESYFGRIRDPESGEKKSVLRKELNSQNFKTESALAAIVDPAIREAVSAQLRLRMSSGKSFKEAMDEGGFRMRSGDDVFQGPPIRKVRSFVRTAEPLKIRRHAYASEAEYKNYIYADTAKGGNFKAALFRAPRGKLCYCLQSLWNWANAHKRPDYVPPEKQPGVGEFLGFIAPGTMVLAYENTPDELKKLSRRELNKRLYKIIVIEKDIQRLSLRYHCEARAKSEVQEEMKKTQGVEEASTISFQEPAKLLKITSGEFSNHLIFEGIDFVMSIDGEIRFLK